jgi:hypothetical protein
LAPPRARDPFAALDWRQRFGEHATRGIRYGPLTHEAHTRVAPADTVGSDARHTAEKGDRQHDAAHDTEPEALFVRAQRPPATMGLVVPGNLDDAVVLDSARPRPFAHVKAGQILLLVLRQRTLLW